MAASVLEYHLHDGRPCTFVVEKILRVYASSRENESNGTWIIQADDACHVAFPYRWVEEDVRSVLSGGDQQIRAPVEYMEYMRKAGVPGFIE